MTRIGQQKLIHKFIIMSRYSKITIQKTWEKAKPIRGRNPNTWRKDLKGNKIRFGSYGTIGKYGWEIDHKKPKAKGGSNINRNFQPLHWKENRKKSDKY